MQKTQKELLEAQKVLKINTHRRKSCPKRTATEDLATLDSTNSANQSSKVELIVKELMKELDVKSPKLIIPQVKALKKGFNVSSNQQKFVDKVSDLLLQFSPPGAFEGRPPVGAIWKWIRNVVQDYSKLKLINKNGI